MVVLATEPKVSLEQLLLTATLTNLTMLLTVVQSTNQFCRLDYDFVLLYAPVS